MKIKLDENLPEVVTVLGGVHGEAELLCADGCSDRQADEIVAGDAQNPLPQAREHEHRRPRVHVPDDLRNRPTAARISPRSVSVTGIPSMMAAITEFETVTRVRATRPIPPISLSRAESRVHQRHISYR